MQIILSNLVKKKIEIVLTEYKSLVSGKDLRGQLYLAGIRIRKRLANATGQRNERMWSRH